MSGVRKEEVVLESGTVRERNGLVAGGWEVMRGKRDGGGCRIEASGRGRGWGELGRREECCGEGRRRDGVAEWRCGEGNVVM